MEEQVQPICDSCHLPPVINIEASLVNVQKGDVMVIRMPPDLPQIEYDRVSRIIRDMLRTQNVKIPVLVLPAAWDVMMVEKQDAEKQECVDCHEMIIPRKVYPICDLMNDPTHNTCTDDCNPTERNTGDPAIGDFYYRCPKCSTLNGLN